MLEYCSAYRSAKAKVRYKVKFRVKNGKRGSDYRDKRCNLRVRGSKAEDKWASDYKWVLPIIYIYIII